MEKHVFSILGGGPNSKALRSTEEVGARNVTVALQGEGRGYFFPIFALRNISMTPKSLRVSFLIPVVDLGDGW